MATPVQSIGTTLSWNSKTIAKLTKIDGIEATLSTIDITTHDSTGNYTEFLPGMFTAGDIAIEGYFDYGDSDGQLAMVTDFNGRTSRTFVITFPASTGTTWTGTGYITAISVKDAGIEGAIPFTATIKPTGKPTLAVATVTGMSAIGFDNDVLIMPAFDIGVYNYVVTITNGQTATVVTPVDSTSGEVITITTDGAASQVVTTGQASSPCTLDVDDVTKIVVTISATGKAPKTYTFNCAVLAS